ncbi:DUF2085 domain-containing protein [Neobacillus niacini]|uniref:DUF2085 domain-containing protein n=1 Tax=Neobacillus niacini TaxID=86668 RepID=UPI0021CB3E6C|nr:DUF2085 domain-containing protein [Neobacillus niacini]MCM3765814.1 DUF2085 domain-containing protein [Neobacillus niacini]
MLDEILHFFGGAICHQLEDRSLMIDGKPLSVCARCTGIYIGIFSTLVYLQLFKRKVNITIPSIKMSFFLLLLMVPLIIDGIGSYINLFESNNLRRLITGMCFGFVLPYFLFPLILGKSLKHVSQPVIKNNKDMFIPILFSASIGGLVYWSKLPYYLFDSLIIFTIVIWFSLCVSFMFSRLNIPALRLAVSVFISLGFLSILSLLHQMAS